MADVDVYLSDVGQTSCIYPDPEHAVRLPWSTVAQSSTDSAPFDDIRGVELHEQDLQSVSHMRQEKSDDDIYYPDSLSDDIAEYYLDTVYFLSSFWSNVLLVSMSSQETSQRFLNLAKSVYLSAKSNVRVIRELPGLKARHLHGEAEAGKEVPALLSSQTLSSKYFTPRRLTCSLRVTTMRRNNAFGVLSE